MKKIGTGIIVIGIAGFTYTFRNYQIMMDRSEYLKKELAKDPKKAEYNDASRKSKILKLKGDMDTLINGGYRLYRLSNKKEMSTLQRVAGEYLELEKQYEKLKYTHERIRERIYPEIKDRVEEIERLNNRTAYSYVIGCLASALAIFSGMGLREHSSQKK